MPERLSHLNIGPMDEWVDERTDAAKNDDKKLLEELKETKEAVTAARNAIQVAHSRDAGKRTANIADQAVRGDVAREDRGIYEAKEAACDRIQEQLTRMEADAADPEQKENNWGTPPGEDNPADRDFPGQHRNELMRDQATELLDYAENLSAELSDIVKGEIAGIRALAGNFRPNIASEAGKLDFHVDVADKATMLKLIDGRQERGNPFEYGELAENVVQHSEMRDHVYELEKRHALTGTEARELLQAIQQSQESTQGLRDSFTLERMFQAITDRKILIERANQPTMEEKELLAARRKSRAYSDRQLAALREYWATANEDT